MTIEEFEKLDLLERLKIQCITIDIATAQQLYTHAKEFKEESLFFAAFVGAISTERISKKKDMYTQYFNGLNIKAYAKQRGQSIGGQKSKRTKAKPKETEDETKLEF